MRANAIMKDLGCDYSAKLRSLIGFHIKMGRTDEEIKVLVKELADETRNTQNAEWQQLTEQAMQYMWQRYREKWPVAKKSHRAESSSGMTQYYYAEVQNINAPPSWAFVILKNEFHLSHRSRLFQVYFSHAELLAHFEKTPPVVTQEEPPVQTSTEKPPIVDADIPEAPEKREGKTTQVKTRPDQLPFAKAVKHNCFDVCVVTGSQIHSRCSAAHLVEHKDGGADYYTNGLWLRWDIHKMMDDGDCAIDPETMTMHFLPYVLEADPDLRAYEGKTLSATRKPINPEFLQGRWRAFQTYLS